MRRKLSKVLLLTSIICLTTVKLFAQTMGIGKISSKIMDAQTSETTLGMFFRLENGNRPLAEFIRLTLRSLRNQTETTILMKDHFKFYIPF
jgi:hypothetical protein